MDKIKLKSKKKRSLSSKQWLLRQLNDPYVAKSKEFGYKSRAAFKLLEIDKKYKILKKGQIILDLGCAPGGWSQIAIQKAAPTGKVIGIDLLPMDPINNVHFIQGDFNCPMTIEKIFQENSVELFDVILSDMAPPTCGINKVDHMRIINLLEEVWEFSQKNLQTNGTLVVKVFRGGTENQILEKLKQNFQKVTHHKPPSSRKESCEIYMVATGYKKNNQD